MPSPGTWSPGDILTAEDLNAIGVWSTYVPELAQSGTVACTVNFARYVKINKMCAVTLDLVATTSGGAAIGINVSLPFAIVNRTNATAIGTGYFFDHSASQGYLLTSLGAANGDTVSFYAEGSNAVDVFGGSPAVTIGANDTLSLSIMYEIN